MQTSWTRGGVLTPSPSIQKRPSPQAKVGSRSAQGRPKPEPPLGGIRAVDHGTPLPPVLPLVPHVDVPTVSPSNEEIYRVMLEILKQNAAPVAGAAPVAQPTPCASIVVAAPVAQLVPCASTAVAAPVAQPMVTNDALLWPAPPPLEAVACAPP